MKLEHFLLSSSSLTPRSNHLSSVPGACDFVVAAENKSVQGLVIKAPAYYPPRPYPCCKIHSKPETILPMVLRGRVKETIGSALKVDGNSWRSQIKQNGGGTRSPHLPELSPCLHKSVLFGPVKPCVSPDAFTFSKKLTSLPLCLSLFFIM